MRLFAVFSAWTLGIVMYPESDAFSLWIKKLKQSYYIKIAVKLKGKKPLKIKFLL